MSDRYLLSVVIPTYNRSSFLDSCLSSLSKQTLPKEMFEVIVVDDGSKDSTKEVVGNFESRLSIQYIYKENNGPAGARNAGIKLSDAELIALVDDDCVLGDDWAGKLIDCFRRFAEVDIIQSIITGCNNNLASFSAARVIDAYAFSGCERRSNYLLAKHFLTCGVALRKKVFQETGYFDERFKFLEDADFDLKIRQLNKIMIFIPGLTIGHFYRSDMRELLIREFNIGRYRCHLNRKWGRERYLGGKIKEVFYWVPLFYTTVRDCGIIRGMAVFILFFAQKTAYAIGYGSEVLSCILHLRQPGAGVS